MIVFKDDKNQINLNKFIPPKLKFEIATYDISVTQNIKAKIRIMNYCFKNIKVLNMLNNKPILWK